MNMKMKIAAGVLAGLVVGAMLVGTAFAAPRLMANAAFGPYSMMRSAETSGSFSYPSFSSMLSFMDGYRNADGSIDFSRMHADVTRGKVKPPCIAGLNSATSTSAPQGRRSTRGYGPSMMRGWTTNDAPTGYGMMGRNY